MSEALEPFGPKVLKRIVTTDALQFYEGPVRSGKTQASLLSLLYYIATHPVRVGIMTGNTVGSVTRNVIKSKMGLIDLCPGAKAVYRDNAYQVIIPTEHGDVTIYVFGGGKANSDDQLRGITAEFWYADEITKHHMTFIAEGMARLAASDYPFMIWTSNPDNPFNPIYTEYTDKFLRMTPEEKRKFGGYHEFHFRLKDNPIMTPDKIEALRLRYSGFEYERKILGKRCIAEGLVYPDVTEAYFREFDTSDVDIRYCALDFGATHPTVMVFGGFFKGNRRDWRLCAEYFDEASGKTTYDHYAGFLDVCRRLGADPNRITIAIDPAAKTIRDEFAKRGLHVIKARNDVLPGIELTHDLIRSGALLFHQSMMHTLAEFRTYSWDTTASEAGMDKPIKQGDDCMDAVRYFVYTHMRPIFRGVRINEDRTA